MNELVFILTPCYNGGGLINRLLDSIVMQTYDNIEMLVIDDGSTDNTAEVVKGYVDVFAKRGYNLRYVYQENQGLAATINNGLPFVHGEYFVWPDCDDFYSDSTAIEQMVNVFRESDEQAGVVRCCYNVVDEDSLEVIGQLAPTDMTKTRIFEDYIYGRNGSWYTPGGYMVRISAMDETIPGRCIYTNKFGGQNAQIMLPILYSYDCVTIPNFLYSYVIRQDSHSRGLYGTNFRRKWNQQNAYLQVLTSTLASIEAMPAAERDRFQLSLRNKYRKIKLNIILRFILSPILPLLKSILKR